MIVQKHLPAANKLGEVPLGQDGPVQRGSFSLEEGQDQLVRGDLGVNEASQRRRLAREELQRPFGDAVPVTDVGIQEVPGAAHHVANPELFQVLRRKTKQQ